MYLHLVEPPDGKIRDGVHLVVTQSDAVARWCETNPSTGEVWGGGRDVLCISHLHTRMHQKVVQRR